MQKENLSQLTPTFYIGAGMWVMITTVMSSHEAAGVLTVDQNRFGVQIKFDINSAVQSIEITAILDHKPVDMLRMHEATGKVIQNINAFNTVLTQARKDNVLNYPH